MSRLRSEYLRVGCIAKDFESNPCYLSELALCAAREIHAARTRHASLTHAEELLGILKRSGQKEPVSRPFLDILDGRTLQPDLALLAYEFCSLDGDKGRQRRVESFFRELSGSYERYWWNVWRRRDTGR